MNKIKAKFDSGWLLVTEHSPNLPSYSGRLHLISYLSYLSAREVEDWYEGWRAVSATFTDYEIIVEVESFEISKAVFFPIYLIQNTQIFLPEKYQKHFIDKLKQPLVEEGWKELATSNQLVSHIGSVCVITLWMKESLSIPSFADHLSQ